MKKLIFENRIGQVARVYDASAFHGSEVTFVYRHDTRRIEPVLDVDSLKAAGVTFDVLHRSSISQLEKAPYRLKERGEWRVAPTEGLKLAPEHSMKPEEDNKDVVIIGKWVTGVQVASIALFLLLGYWLQSEIKKDEEVTAIRAVQLEPAREKPVFSKPVQELKAVVTPPKHAIVRHKPVPKKVEPKIVTRKAPKVSNRMATAQAPKASPRLDQLGALGALGGVGKKMQSGGGLNLSGSSIARGGEKGSGGGGVGGLGSGGMTNALFGKGLVAASPGSGARAGSAGGYGTRGSGGGRQGYGDNRIVGSSGGSVAPLDSESFIEGGLTRAQVEEVIMRNMGQITYCYEKGLQIEPSLRGRVAVSFTIGANGKVSVAQVQHTSVDSRQLESCIVGRVKQFQFPRPVAGVNVQVQYPFSFRRVSSN